MVNNAKKTKMSENMDKFLHHIQKQKMKELWDGREDEVWDHY